MIPERVAAVRARLWRSFTSLRAVALKIAWAWSYSASWASCRLWVEAVATSTSAAARLIAQTSSWLARPASVLSAMSRTAHFVSSPKYCVACCVSAQKARAARQRCSVWPVEAQRSATVCSWLLAGKRMVWQRETMVGNTASAEVASRMKTVSAGGSSRLLSRAFAEEEVRSCASAII